MHRFALQCICVSAVSRARCGFRFSSAEQRLCWPGCGGAGRLRVVWDSAVPTGAILWRRMPCARPWLRPESCSTWRAWAPARIPKHAQRPALQICKNVPASVDVDADPEVSVTVECTPDHACKAKNDRCIESVAEQQKQADDMAGAILRAAGELGHSRLNRQSLSQDLVPSLNSAPRMEVSLSDSLKPRCYFVTLPR